MHSRYLAVTFLQITHERYPWFEIWMSFMSTKSGQNFTFENVVLCAISCSILLRYIESLWHHGCRCSGCMGHEVITYHDIDYCQFSNIRRTQSPNINVSRLVLQLSLPNLLKPWCQVENEDVVGAAPRGDAPTTSEWSTILLPTKARLILETLRYV